MLSSPEWLRRLVMKHVLSVSGQVILPFNKLTTLSTATYCSHSEIFNSRTFDCLCHCVAGKCSPLSSLQLSKKIECFTDVFVSVHSLMCNFVRTFCHPPSSLRIAKCISRGFVSTTVYSNEDFSVMYGFP